MEWVLLQYLVCSFIQDPSVHEHMLKSQRNLRGKLCLSFRRLCLHRKHVWDKRAHKTMCSLTSQHKPINTQSHIKNSNTHTHTHKHRVACYQYMDSPGTCMLVKETPPLTTSNSQTAVNHRQKQTTAFWVGRAGTHEATRTCLYSGVCVCESMLDKHNSTLTAKPSSFTSNKSIYLLSSCFNSHAAYYAESAVYSAYKRSRPFTSQLNCSASNYQFLIFNLFIYSWYQALYWKHVIIHVYCYNITWSICFTHKLHYKCKNDQKEKAQKYRNT